MKAPATKDAGGSPADAVAVADGEPDAAVVIRLDVTPDLIRWRADVPRPSDTSTAPDLPDHRPDAVAAPKDVWVQADVQAETTAAVDGGPSPPCAPQTLDAVLVPVTGTVTGPRVDGSVCDDGLGSFFMKDGLYAPYVQSFSTTSQYSSRIDPPGPMESWVWGFLLRQPANSTAILSGWVAASDPLPGEYDSESNCGYLNFEVSLPIPPGIVCPAEFPPCGPDCEGVGEMWVCQPAHPRLHYAARSPVHCLSYDDPAQGSWNLRLDEVSPLDPSAGRPTWRTRGHLTAALVNQGDAADSVQLELDF